MSVAMTFFPLPTHPYVIYVGEQYAPWLVAVVGGVATCVAGLIDYLLLSLLMRYQRIRKLQQSSWYLRFSAFFRSMAFVTLVVAAFTPIPFDPFRFLAITTEYDKKKYILAIFVGRAPRYFILARVGSEGYIPNWILIWVFVLLFGIAVWKNYGKIRDNFTIIYKKYNRGRKRE